MTDAHAAFESFQAHIGFRIINKSLDVSADEFYVEGWATTDDVDFEDDVFDRRAMDAMAQGLLISSTVFFNHDYSRDIGVVREAAVEKTERGWGVRIKVFISKTEMVIRTKIAEGVLSGFSVGGRLLQAITESNEQVGRKVRRIVDFLIYEVSVVGIPCNRMARAINWYVKQYRDLAESLGKKLRIDQFSALDAIAQKTDNFVVKGLPPHPPGTLFEEAASREDAEIMLEKKAVSSHTTAMADRARRWDGDAADGRWRKHYSSDGSGDKDTMNWSGYRMGHAWYDAENEEAFGSYKMQHHDIVNGEPKVVFRGVVAAVVVMQGGRGGVNIPDGDREGVRKHLRTHYQQFEPDVDPFDKSVDEVARGLQSQPDLLHLVKAAMTDEEWLKATGVAVRKALELHGLDLSRFLDNLWKAALSSGVFGPIVDDGWFPPLWIQTVYESSVVFFNSTDEKMRKADFASENGVDFVFSNVVEVTPRVVYDEVKAVSDLELHPHPRILRRALPEHQTPISKAETWEEKAALDEISKWASSDASGDTATIDWSRYSLAFAWYQLGEQEGDASKFLLPHHQIEESELALNSKGLDKAVAALKDSDDNLGIPAEELEGVRRHLVAHLRQIDPDAANPFEESATVTTQDGEVVVEPESKNAEPQAVVEPPVVEPAVEPVEEPAAVEPPPVTDDDKSAEAMAQLLEQKALEALAKVFGTGPTIDDLRRAISGLNAVAEPTVLDFDAEDAEQRIRRFCSSDGSGDKSKMDWNKFKGFFAKFEGALNSFKSYSMPLYDIQGDVPVVVRSAVQAVVDAHKSGTLVLTEPDKRRVQTAWKTFRMDNPFAVSAEESARKAVQDQMEQVSAKVLDLDERVKGVVGVLDTLKQDLERAATKDEVTNLISGAVSTIEQRLTPLEAAAGVSKQLPVATGTGPSRSTSFQGVFTNINRIRKNIED